MAAAERQAEAQGLELGVVLIGAEADDG